jgi:hypothetical protein
MAGAAGFTATGQPLRPYSSPDQLDGATPRSTEFATGQVGDPGNAASSLNQDSQRWNLSAQFRPTSVLQPVMRNPGGLGMSAGDASRRLADGTYMGSVNGTSISSFEPAAMLRLTTGQDAE